MTDEELLNLYTKGGASSTRSVTPDSKTLSDQDLINLYTAGPSKDVVTTEDIMSPAKDELGKVKQVAGGLIRGGLDVGETVAENALKLASTAAPLFYKSDTADAIRKYKEETIAENKAERDKFAAENPSLSPGDIGRMGGQILTTLPMFPGRVAKSIDVAAGALPTTLPSGVTVAAPMARRLGATIATGAAAGAEFGALTSPGEEVGGALKGMVTGAVAGPLMAGIAKTGEWTARGLRSMYWNNEIKQLVLDTGIDAKAAKNVVKILDDAGYTPQTAAAEVKRLGPSATLMDIDPSIAMEAGGLAQLGGQPTSILKNVVQDRAATANDQALNIIKTKLGPKPNIEAERQAIRDQAEIAVSGDYKTAHASPQQLNSASIVSDIDKALEDSVGKETSVLKEVKSYLFRNVKDANGNIVPELRTDVFGLHKARIGLDDLLGRLPSEGTSQASATYRAANNVRKAVDAELKTVPEMAAADAKFSEKMKVRDALDYGNEFDKKGNTIEQFTKEFTAATPEAQDALRKGMLTRIHDVMDEASRGEFAAAQQLFGKKALNRKKLQVAFGQNADEVLDEVAKEISFRSTEKYVDTGSRTAFNQAVREKYSKTEGIGGTLKDIVHAGMLEAATGSGGTVAALGTIRALGHAGRQRLLKSWSENMSIGTADLLSRQGVMRDEALNKLGAVRAIQDRTQPQINLPRLPIAGIPFLNEAYNKLNEQ